MIEPEIYARFESIVRQWINHRDQDDWPITAAALALQWPIWTKDTDFLTAAYLLGPQIEWKFT